MISRRFLPDTDKSLKLTDVINASLDAVVVLDKNGYIIDWNKNATAMFGFEKEEVIQKKLRDIIIPPEMREQHTKGMEKFKKSRSSRLMNTRLEMPALHKLGHTFPVELVITFTKKSKNQILFYRLFERSLYFQEN